MADNVSYIFQKKLTEKQVARQNFEASMSELPPESVLAIKLAELVEKIDISIFKAKELIR